MNLQPTPPGFINNVFEFSFETEAGETDVWQWLNDTRTFTDTQYWTWRVEFYDPQQPHAIAAFQEGVLTNHHGPLINLAGTLTKIEPNRYRDLQYYYGSYALNFRWIRPYRLEFHTEVVEGRTKVTGRLSAYVKEWVSPWWTKAQRYFWSRFKSWAQKSISKQTLAVNA